MNIRICYISASFSLILQHLNGTVCKTQWHFLTKQYHERLVDRQPEIGYKTKPLCMIPRFLKHCKEFSCFMRFNPVMFRKETLKRNTCTQHRFPEVIKDHACPPKSNNNNKTNKLKKTPKQNKLETPLKAKITQQLERLGNIKVCYMHVPESKTLSN